MKLPETLEDVRRIETTLSGSATSFVSGLLRRHDTVEFASSIVDILNASRNGTR